MGEIQICSFNNVGDLALAIDDELIDVGDVDRFRSPTAWDKTSRLSTKMIRITEIHTIGNDFPTRQFNIRLFNENSESLL